MVVEDDVEMNELEREFLDVHGLDSVPAYTGDEAIELCGRYQADAVLLDIMLPEMDGLEACHRLREARGKGLPIVIVSALDSEEMRRRGLEAGADAYFVKPFDPDEVVEKVQQLINHRGNGDGAS